MDCIRTLLLFFIALPLLSACSTLEKPFFYEIERDGKKGHVLGTAHMGFGASELPSYVQKKMNDSKVFASEVHYAWVEQTPEQYKAEYKNKLNRRWDENKRNSVKLSQLLSPKAFEMYKTAYREKINTKETDEELEYYLPETAYYVMLMGKPLYATYVSQQQAYGMKQRLDLQLYERAKKQGKMIVPLDSLEVYDEACRDKKYIFYIEQVAKAVKRDRNAEIDHFFWMYESGDERALEAYMKSDSWTEGLDGCVMHERNAKWADKLDELFKDNDSLFVAVGAGHLVGEKSLFEYLDKKGFKHKRSPLQD